MKFLQLRSVESIVSNDEQTHERRVKQKLLTPLDEVVPDPRSLKGWFDNISEIPDFTEGDDYNYLVITMKAKRQLKSRVFFEDRHVHDLKYHTINEKCSHCLV